MSEEENRLFQRLIEDVHSHGEVHAVIEEAGAGDIEGEEVEIRLGTAEFDTEAHMISVEDGQTVHRFSFDRIVRWYMPMDFGHE